MIPVDVPVDHQSATEEPSCAFRSRGAKMLHERTVVHEFDDAVCHLGGVARFDEEAWWLESTATWIEEICEPNSDDYIQYIQNLLREK